MTMARHGKETWLPETGMMPVIGFPRSARDKKKQKKASQACHYHSIYKQATIFL
jgi:hypothetical protein